MYYLAEKHDTKTPMLFLFPKTVDQIKVTPSEEKFPKTLILAFVFVHTFVIGIVLCIIYHF